MPRIEPVSAASTVAPVAEDPLKPAMKMLGVVNGPIPLPQTARDAVEVFDKANADFDADRVADAARGFMKAAALFIADRPERYRAALDKNARIAWYNAAEAFRFANLSTEGAQALGDAARAADDDNRAFLEQLSAGP